MSLRQNWRAAGVVLVVLLMAVGPAASQTTTTTKSFTASEASHHPGESATVCGKVVSTRYAASSRGQPTFLNFDRPYPDRVFTVVIWGTDRATFGRPEEKYRDKRACVTGTINTYRGVPQIVATRATQLRLAVEAQPQSDDH